MAKIKENTFAWNETIQKLFEMDKDTVNNEVEKFTSNRVDNIIPDDDIKRVKMESGKNDIVYRYIRNIDDDRLLKFIRKVYDYGYTDGYNGNDADKEFSELIEEIYKNAIE